MKKYFGLIIISFFLFTGVYFVEAAMPSFNFGTKTLYPGMRGSSEVKELQRFLGIKEDGSYGPSTKTEVVAWQTINQLPPDGVFGYKSRIKALSGTTISKWNPGLTPTISPISIPCTKTGPPAVKIISPNGGETFSVGQQVTVKWTSCNLSSTTNMNIMILNASTPQTKTSVFDSFVLPAKSAQNTGTVTFTIPNDTEKASRGYPFPAVPGQAVYKVRIGEAKNEIVYDYSDNFFTINK